MADDTRERILDGALEMLQGKPAHDVTMERLADWTGVSRKTIYNHFSGKSELVSEAIATGMDRVVRRLSTIAEDTALGFVEKLDRIVEQGFRETRLLWYSAEESSAPRIPRELRSTARELNSHLRGLIQHIITEAASAGLLADEVNPAVLTRVIFNIITGIRYTDEADTLSLAPLELLRESLRICMVGALSSQGVATLAGSQILSRGEGTP